MRYFLHLGFDGTRYSGWQKQTNSLNTVQEVVEQSLIHLFKKPITVYGCGRTDAGVHASQYILHINLEEAPTFDLLYRLNKKLPEDIAVFEILEVKEDQHARYDATSRSYDYFIHWKKDPALIRYSTFIEDIQMDFDRMQKAADLLLKTKDFKRLCKQPDSYKNTLCHLTTSTLFVDEERGRLRYRISSNRFLRGMVRICVFLLLKVGNGQMSLKEFEAFLKQEKEIKQLHPALPQGLFLSEIEYPFVEFKESHHLMQMLKMGLEE